MCVDQKFRKKKEMEDEKFSREVIKPLVDRERPFGESLIYAPLDLEKMMFSEERRKVLKPLYYYTREHLFPEREKPGTPLPKVNEKLSKPLSDTGLFIFLKCNKELQKRHPERKDELIITAEKMKVLWATLTEMSYTSPKIVLKAPPKIYEPKTTKPYEGSRLRNGREYK